MVLLIFDVFSLNIGMCIYESYSSSIGSIIDVMSYAKLNLKGFGFYGNLDFGSKLVPEYT